MGFAGLRPMSLLLILAIVIVLFGTKRIREIGQDLGAAVKSFREGLNGTDEKSDHDLK